MRYFIRDSSSIVFGDQLVSLNMAAWKGKRKRVDGVGTKGVSQEQEQGQETHMGDIDTYTQVEEYVGHNAESFLKNEKVKFHSAKGKELDYRAVFPDFFL